MPGVRTVVTIALGFVVFSASGQSRPAASGPTTRPQAPPAASRPQAAGDRQTLTIGDAAPKLDIADWLKGEPYPGFEPGKICIVEFWATWCPHCKEAMRHLSALQNQYRDKGVTVIAVTEEKPEIVTEFLASDHTGKPWTDEMAFRVASDSDRSSAVGYMSASGQMGIPTAYIVGKDSRIEWIGHPDHLDGPLMSVVDGTWNREQFKEEWAKSRVPADPRKSKNAEDLRIATEAGDWKTAIEVLDRSIAENPEAPGAKFRKFKILLIELNDPEKAYAYLQEAMSSVWYNAAILNVIVDVIVNDPKVEHRDLDLAGRLAAQANSLTAGRFGPSLRLVAKVHFLRGELEQAVEWQTKAVARSGERTQAEWAAELQQYADALAARPKQ